MDNDEYVRDKYGERHPKLCSVRCDAGDSHEFTAAGNALIYSVDREFHLKTVTAFNGDTARRTVTLREGAEGTVRFRFNVGADNHGVENFNKGPVFTEDVYGSIDGWGATMDVGVWGEEVAHTIPLTVPS